MYVLRADQAPRPCSVSVSTHSGVGCLFRPTTRPKVQRTPGCEHSVQHIACSYGHGDTAITLSRAIPGTVPFLVNVYTRKFLLHVGRCQLNLNEWRRPQLVTPLQRAQPKVSARELHDARSDPARYCTRGTGGGGDVNPPQITAIAYDETHASITATRNSIVVLHFYLLHAGDGHVFDVYQPRRSSCSCARRLACEYSVAVLTAIFAPFDGSDLGSIPGWVFVCTTKTVSAAEDVRLKQY